MSERFTERQSENHGEHFNDLLKSLYLDVQRPKLEGDEYNEHEILVYAERFLTSIGVANVYAATPEIVTPHQYLTGLLDTLDADKRRLVPAIAGVVASEAAFHPGSTLNKENKGHVLGMLRFPQVSTYAQRNEGDPAYFMADFRQRMENMQSKMRADRTIFRANLKESRELWDQFSFDYREDMRMFGLEQARESKLRRGLGAVIRLLGTTSPYSNHTSDT